MPPDTRVLPAAWLGSAVPVGVLGYLGFALSDSASDRRAGLILVGLAALAILMGGLLVARPRLAVVRASLVVSLLWLLGAAVAALDTEFGQDNLLFRGLPAAVAVVTAMLARQRLRDPHRA